MLVVRGRSTLQAVLLVGLLVATLAVPVLPAHGESITQVQGQIATLSKKLSQLEKTSEITANQYDADKAAAAGLANSIITLQSEEAKKRTAIAATGNRLEVAVVRAYVFGASAAQIESLFNQDVTSSDARAVYETQAVGNLHHLKTTYQRQKSSLQATIAKVAAAKQKKIQQTKQMQYLLNENAQLQNSARVELDTLTSRLKSEIINYEISAGVAAAHNHDTNAETQAINAASAVGGQAAANLVITAIQAAITAPKIGEIAGSKQGLAAVHFAETQIGVPYVWGGETPGVGFDCSGLTQWAWARAGFQIPRTTETQWPALQHVPLTALQPGDLLFYYNLDGDHLVDHEVMYVGSGPWGVNTTIAAAHTGTNVSLAPLFTAGLIGAARP